MRTRVESSRLRLLRRVGLALVFLLALVPRAVTPVSRPLQWHFRSVQFIDAVLEGRWSDTIFSEHPGVTAMWIAGTTEHLVYRIRGALGQNPPPLSDIDGRAFIFDVSVGVAALALVISGAIVLAWFPLKRLFGEGVAWIAVLLMALDPYYLTNSKVLHLDALLAALMTLSALWMLVFARDGDRRAFLLSAVCGGLAQLTKAPALFLLPYSALSLLLLRVRDAWPSLGKLFHRIALPLLAWCGIVGAVFFVLYPAMWTVPLEAVGLVSSWTAHYVAEPHFNPVFFHGRAHIDDPGPLYYIYALAFRSTWVSLSFSALAMVGLRRSLPSRRVVLLLVAAYVLCFGLQMTIGEKKFVRYLLPAFPLLDTLAAVGWDVWRVGLERRLGRRPLTWAAAMLPIVVLAGMVLPLHPYYGMHYNWLFGEIEGARREFALQEQAEGVDIAARWLNELGEEGLRVAVQQPDMLMQYTDAQVVEFDSPEIDYLVFDRNHLVRGYHAPEWGDTWLRYRSREPAFQVGFRNIQYVWVYEAFPAGDATPEPDLEYGGWLGEGLELVGYDWQEERVEPGEPLPLRLYWRSDQTPVQDLTVFVHLVGQDGQLVAQCDSQPQGGQRPTSTWQPGELVPDECDVMFPMEAAEGRYDVLVGMYAWPELERLPAQAPDGSDVADGRLSIVTFEWYEPQSWWAGVALAWVATIFVFAVGAIGVGKDVTEGNH